MAERGIQLKVCRANRWSKCPRVQSKACECLTVEQARSKLAKWTGSLWLVGGRGMIGARPYLRGGGWNASFVNSCFETPFGSHVMWRYTYMLVRHINDTGVCAAIREKLHVDANIYIYIATGASIFWRARLYIWARHVNIFGRVTR